MEERAAEWGPADWSHCAPALSDQNAFQGIKDTCSSSVSGDKDATLPA